jgi:hypothetical protein
MAYAATEYFWPPYNYIGTFLFISYIVAALELINFLIPHIFTLHEQASRKPLTQRPRFNHILCFSILAALSFSVLSYNMLAFLFQSYSTWCKTNGYVLAFQIRDISPKLWAWMTDSTLFSDFAQDLAKNSQTWTPVGMALVGTMLLSQYMGIQGTFNLVTCSLIYVMLMSMQGKNTAFPIFGHTLFLDRFYLSRLLRICSTSHGFAFPLAPRLRTKTSSRRRHRAKTHPLNKL